MTEDDDGFAVDLVDELSDDEIGATPRLTFWGSNSNLQKGDNAVNATVGGKPRQLVQCGISHICHGTWVPDGNPATLIVMQFAFQAFGHNKRFKSAEITLTLNVGASSMIEVPLKALAPNGSYDLLPSKATKEISHMINPSIKATMGLGEAGVGYQWQYRTSFDSEKSARLQGAKMESNVAFWGIYENPATHQMPTFLQTAVLVKRGKVPGKPLGGKFTATLKIEAMVDRVAFFEDKITGVLKEGRKDKKMSREKDNILEFDPQSSKGKIDWLDTSNLEDLEDKLQVFQQLITVKEWVDGGSKPNEVKTEGTTNPEAGPTQERQSISIPNLLAHNKSKEEDERKQVNDDGLPEQTSIRGAEAVAPLPEKISQTESLITPLLPASSNALEAPENPLISGHSPSDPLLDLEPNLQGGAPTQSQGKQHESQPPKHPITKLTTTSTDKRLAELRDRLGRVRIEASLVRRLIALEEEERKILQEIMQLEVQSSLTDRLSALS